MFLAGERASFRRILKRLSKGVKDVVEHKNKSFTKNPSAKDLIHGTKLGFCLREKSGRGRALLNKSQQSPL